jgi:hypothetical protein
MRQTSLKLEFQGYIHKAENLENIGKSIVKVNQRNDHREWNHKRENISRLVNRNKSERLHEKFSNEISITVLKYR